MTPSHPRIVTSYSIESVLCKPCTTEIYIHVMCAHGGRYFDFFRVRVVTKAPDYAAKQTQRQLLQLHRELVSLPQHIVQPPPAFWLAALMCVVGA